MWLTDGFEHIRKEASQASMWIQIHMDWATDPELPENPLKNDKNSLMTEKYPRFHTDARDECCLHILRSIDNNRLLLSSILVQKFR
jgi:hypothetical protein